MTNNDKYVELFESFNNQAKELGFAGVYSWAQTAVTLNLLTKNDLDRISCLRYLRTLNSHGHARDLKINKKAFESLKFYIERIELLKIKPLEKKNKKQNSKREIKDYKSYRVASKDNYRRENRYIY